MDSKKFLKYYRDLNSAQKKAVDTIEGPVMVVAGPGTGKTRVLTLRIANILMKTDTMPENILALTFTESGAYSMRKNLVDIIGSVAYRVNISTFHGFCNEVIKNNPEEFGKIIGSTNIDTIDQIKILESIIEEISSKTLKPYGDIFFYIYPILQKISELKKDAVDPEELSLLIENEEKIIKSDKNLRHKSGRLKGEIKGEYVKRLNNIKKNKELVEIYKKYQKALFKNHLYDYEDMIMEVLGALKENKELLLSLQEEYQYILADEHQDVNRGQNKVLELLASYHAPFPNLFIVGDEKQAIFKFQGASLDNFMYFKKLYPEVELIELTTNYRSTQNILDASHSVILSGRKDDSTSPKPLKSKKVVSGNVIKLYEFSHSRFEPLFIKREIARLIKRRVPPGEIAVIYRDNKDALAVIETLEGGGIPFSIESDQNILNDDNIRKLILLLKAINSFGNDIYLVDILHTDFLGINPLDTYKLISIARNKRKNIYDVMKDTNYLKRIGLEDVDKTHALFKQLMSWKRLSSNRKMSSFFEILLEESGFLRYILNREKTSEGLEKLNDLYEEIKNISISHDNYYLSDFVEYLNMVERYNILLKRRQGALVLNSVRLMTAHRSKGLEFSYIFIIDVRDRHWGGRRGRDYFPISYISKNEVSDIEDERRLFYVALTRAKEGIIISYSKEGQDGTQRLPSQFIEEIDKKFIKNIDTKNIETSLSRESRSIKRKPREYEYLHKEKEYFNNLFAENGLSVTALNNYLSCPWRYFYRNLVRIPEVQTKSQMYGSAVHETFRVIFELVNKGEEINNRDIIKIFKDTLSRYPFSKSELGEYLKRGNKAIRGYIKNYKNEWSSNVLNEFNIRGVILSPGIKLNGKLDKIEFIDHGVNVVDYKTGKTHGRNFIEGKTKSSNGDYKRQLIFYKILLNLYGDERFNMTTGEIDFVEPDDRGLYKKEKFEITDSEIKELEKLIIKVSKEIKELSFWGIFCGDKRCRYCRLRRTMS